jgi:hypothetical protein
VVPVIEWTEAELARLAEQKVAKAPDGSLRNGRDEPVSDGLACILLAHESGTHPVSPGDYQRPYLQPGHSANSPANRRTALPVPPPDPATGGRSTTPPDDCDGVEKVAPGFRQVEPEAFARGPLIAGHETPSPGDRGDNNPVLPGTASGHEVYGHAAEAFNANVAAARAQHVMPSQACTAEHATSRWSPSPDLGARNVPVPASPGHLAGHTPGE